MASGDGVEWDVVYSNEEWTLHDVTWAEDRFIAVGGHYVPGLEGGAHPGVILTSENGRDWAEQHLVDWSMLIDVSFNGEQTLVVGYPGITLTSPDGITWLKHLQPEHLNAEMVDVAWNGAIYIAVGAPNYFSGGMAVYQSSDGVVWSMASLDGITEMGLLSAVWGHDRFLVTGGLWPNIPIVLTSTDGNLWTEIPTNLPGIVNEIEATSDGYIGVGALGLFVQSTDGTSWSSMSVAPQGQRLRDVVSPRYGEYLVVGDDGAIAVSTDSGNAWTLSTTWKMEGISSIVDLSIAGGVIMAASDTGKVFRSLDGFEWRTVENLPAGLFSIQRLNNAFWIVGVNGLVASSDDGLEWASRGIAPGIDFADIASNEDLIVAVGSRDTGQLSALAATSSDGYSWDLIDLEDALGLRISSVAWSGSRFVGVGNRGTFFNSEDGYQWEHTAVDPEWVLNRVVSNGTVLVAAGKADKYGRGLLLKSDDGVGWEPTIVELEVWDVTWTGSLFVAVGRGLVHTSPNGNEWNTESVGFAAYPSCVAGDGKEIIASGDGSLTIRGKHVSSLPRRGGGRARP